MKLDDQKKSQAENHSNRDDIDVKISGKTKWVRKTNKNITKVIVGKDPVSSFIEKKQLNWYWHI